MFIMKLIRVYQKIKRAKLLGKHILRVVSSKRAGTNRKNIMKPSNRRAHTHTPQTKGNYASEYLRVDVLADKEVRNNVNLPSESGIM